MEAHYFDGQTSRRQIVRLSGSAAGLLIENAEGKRRAIPTADIRVSEPQGSAPRTLRFAGDETFCEVAQGAELDALLTDIGYRASVVMRLQSKWRWVGASLAGVILVFVAGYFWGLPWGAKALAPQVPVTAMHPISNMALAQLDKEWLTPSELAKERQEKLRAGFWQLVAADPALLSYEGQMALHFRAFPRHGPNAFAFPDGQIVLLDELVALHDDDDEILAVLAHEIGHLSKRHGIRQLIQHSVMAAVAAAWFGDISQAAVMVSTVLLTSGYSRDMEREADDYAASLLKQQGKSPELLATALEKMERADGKRGQEEDAEESDPEKKDKTRFLDWLSSHPDTQERIRRLRGLAP